MQGDATNPPSDWAHATGAGHDVYFTTGQTQDDVIVWHWCAKPEDSERPRWLGQRVPLHQLISLAPLHLEPSLACADGCPWHGYLRQGHWTPV